jgi:formylglycine-generating enzyme required for sulfatase activity
MTLTAVTPAAVSGAVEITVTANGRVGSLSRAFSYSGSSITGVVPSVGAAQGGGVVVITGAFLANTSAVWFGDVPAQSFTQVSDTQVNAIAPAGTAQTSVDVRLTTTAGLTVAPAAYSYVSIVVPTWATLLEAVPDPAVVWDASLRAAITATGLAWRVKDTVTQIELLLVPAGEFQMGCIMGSNQWGCVSDELPVHWVTLTNAFYLGRFEVTQAQWVAMMGSNPSYFVVGNGYPGSDARPVERVSWATVQGYLAATGFRLPTEAEWEYACRAGTQAPFYNGSADDSTLATLSWYSVNSIGQTRPVGGKAGNAFGFHDTYGNAFEWVSDWFGPYPASPQSDPVGPPSGYLRVQRGGSVHYPSYYGRSSSRRGAHPQWAGEWYEAYGFRVARNP